MSLSVRAWFRPAVFTRRFYSGRIARVAMNVGK
jgi:hypothetical protein